MASHGTVLELNEFPGHTFPTAAGHASQYLSHPGNYQSHYLNSAYLKGILINCFSQAYGNNFKVLCIPSFSSYSFIFNIPKTRLSCVTQNVIMHPEQLQAKSCNFQKIGTRQIMCVDRNYSRNLQFEVTKSAGTWFLKE